MWVQSLEGRISLGVGNGTPLQYSRLGNPIRGAWWATVHGATKSQTRSSNRHREPYSVSCNNLQWIKVSKRIYVTEILCWTPEIYILLIYFHAWLCWSSLLSVDFPLQWLLLSGSTGPRTHGPSGVGESQVYLPRDMQDPSSQTRDRPESPALAGRFLTTGHHDGPVHLWLTQFYKSTTVQVRKVIACVTATYKVTLWWSWTKNVNLLFSKTKIACFKNSQWGLPWCHVVKNLPVNAGDTGLTPAWEYPSCPFTTAAKPVLRSPGAAAAEARVRAPQPEKPLQWEACAPQPDSSPCSLHWRVWAAPKTQHRQKQITLRYDSCMP